jgi:oligogalacturonide transport system substrate-binding protein
MQKFNINRKAAILLLLLCAAMLTGCSGNNTASAETNSAEAVEIDFSWWGDDERHIYTMNAVDIFQEMNPDINVNYRYGIWSGFEKRTKVWMASRKEADVMQINYSWLSEYSPDGNGFYDLYELTDYIDLSNFTEDDLKFGEIDGKLNAIPIAFNTPTMYYNEDIYSSYGLSLPTTWDDFFTAASVMKEDGIYPLGMAKKQLFLFLLAYYEQSTGNHFFDENGQLLAGPDDLQYILEFYKRLLDEQVLIPVDQFSRSKFAQGDVAGSMFWISDADKYCSSLEDYGGTPVIGDYPMLENAALSGWYMKPATMYAISSISDAPEEAATLLDFLVNSKIMAHYQGTEKGVPVSTSAVKELEAEQKLEGYGYEANQKMLENRYLMEIMLPVMENEDFLDAFKEDSNEYLYDKITLTTCARKLYADLTSIIKQSS